MNRERNLGIYTYCVVCGRRFWTDTGESVCINCQRTGRDREEFDEDDDDEDD